MTGEIYQNLVVGLDEKAPESVHLCLWPEVDEKAIDKKLENEMDLVYSLNEMLEKLVKKFESEIKKETLTENILFNKERKTYTEVSINDEKLMLDVEIIK